MPNKRIKNAIKNYNKGLRMMSSAKNTLMNGGMIYQVGGTINTVQPQRQTNVNNMVSSLQNINRTFLPNNILGNNNVQSVLQERPSLYQGGGWKNIAAAYFGNNANGISYRNSPLHAYNQGLRQGKQFQMGGAMPQQEEQFADESGQYMNELAGQTPGQQNAPQQEGMEQEGGQQLSEQEMMQLAQLILQGDEEALKLAEQLPQEQQQILMQMIQQMQQQGAQGQQQAQAPQPSEEEMMMQQQAMQGQEMSQGQEMPMMMVGGMKKKKRKPVTKSSYYSHGGAIKKGVNKSLYQMLGIPC